MNIPFTYAQARAQSVPLPRKEQWLYILILLVLAVIITVAYARIDGVSSVIVTPMLFAMILIGVMSVVFILIYQYTTASPSAPTTAVPASAERSEIIRIMRYIWPLLGATCLGGIGVALVLYLATAADISNPNGGIQILVTLGIFAFIATVLYKTLDASGPVGGFIRAVNKYVPCLTDTHRTIVEWGGMLFLLSLLLYFIIRGFISIHSGYWAWWSLQIVLLMMLGTLIKVFFYPSADAQKGKLQHVIQAFLLYVSCKIRRDRPKTATEARDWKFMAGSIILFAGYFVGTVYITPWLVHFFFNHQGIQLLNSPQTLSIASNYAGAPDIPGKNYQYAVGFWVYIDSFASSTSMGYGKTNNRIFSYGGVPHIAYDAATNTMVFSAQTDSTTQPQSQSQSHAVANADDNDNDNADDNANSRSPHVVYRHPNVLMQKWNYIVVNYAGGTLDIFYNGKLEKSVPNVVMYQEQAMVESGEEGGIHGDICNIMYYDAPIDLHLIHRMYTALKDQNPPHISTSIWTLAPLG